MKLRDAADTIYKNVPQDKIVPLKGRFGSPLMFLDFFFLEQMTCNFVPFQLP